MGKWTGENCRGFFKGENGVIFTKSFTSVKQMNEYARKFKSEGGTVVKLVRI